MRILTDFIQSYNLVFLCGTGGFIGFFVRIWHFFCGAFFVFVYDFISATKGISSKLLHIIKVAVARKGIAFKLQIWDLITNFGSWLMVVSFNDLLVFTSTADKNKSYKNINKCFHSEIIDKKSKFANLQTGLLNIGDYSASRRCRSQETTLRFASGRYAGFATTDFVRLAMTNQANLQI